MTSNLPRIKEHLDEVTSVSINLGNDCNEYLQGTMKELQRFCKQLTNKILEVKEVWKEIEEEEEELEENGLSITKNMPLKEIKRDTWLLERSLGEAITTIGTLEDMLKALIDGYIEWM